MQRALHARSALALILTLAACAAPPSLPRGEEIGEPISTGEVVRLAAVEASPGRFLERTLLVEATVKSVCRKKGCWMQVQDGAAVWMVRWEAGCGGKYAFPVDAVGRRVLIQGSCYPKSISEADAEHLEEESGGTLEVRREGYEINASAVRILPR